MSRPASEEPTVVGYCSVMGKETKHPAYGMVHASRIPGHTELFGSEVKHQNYVRLEISEARQYENFGGTLTSMPKLPIASVELTEAQWVGLISRMNTSGVECTIRFRFTESPALVATLPQQTIGEQRLSGMVEKMTGHLGEQVTGTAKELSGFAEKMGKRQGEQFIRTLDRLVSHLYANAKYCGQVLTEHKERMVNDAKTEIEASTAAMVTRLGMRSIDELQQVLMLADQSPVEQPRITDEREQP